MAGAQVLSYIIEVLTTWRRRNCAGGSRLAEGCCISSWSIGLNITSANWHEASSFSPHDASLCQAEHVITPANNAILHTPAKNQFPISFYNLHPSTCFCRCQVNTSWLSQNSCTAQTTWLLSFAVCCFVVCTPHDQSQTRLTHCMIFYVERSTPKQVWAPDHGVVQHVTVSRVSGAGLLCMERRK